MHQTDPLPFTLKPLLGHNVELHHCTLALRFLEGQILLQKRDPKTKAQVDYFISPQDAADCFLNVPSDSGWLPACVIRHGRKHGESWAVFYEPPMTRRFRVACDDRFRPVPEVAFVDLKVPFPGLCCLLSGANAWGWALKGNGFQKRAIAYCLPLPNVSTEGLMCFGAQDHPLLNNSNGKQIVDIWLSGTFNGHQIGHKCQSYETDVRHLLWDLHQRRTKRFPAAELIGQQSIEATLQYRLAHL